MKKMCLIFIVFFELVLVASFAMAQGEVESPVISTDVQQKSITGEVMGSGADYVAIIYKKEGDAEYEILLPFDKNSIVFEGVQNIKQITTGDNIMIEYDEVTATKEDGSTTAARKAKKIKFLSPASTSLKSGK